MYGYDMMWLHIKDNGKSMALNIRQKKYLRQQAHARKPVVTVGNPGLSAAVLAEVRIALRTHELLKIKLPAGARGRIPKITSARPSALFARNSRLATPCNRPNSDRTAGATGGRII